MLMTPAECNKLWERDFSRLLLILRESGICTLWLLWAGERFKQAKEIYSCTFRKANLSQRVSSVMSGDV